MTEKFCLRWNDFASNISSAFKDIRDERELFDVTIVCGEEEQIEAHKVILSACSSLFRSILRKNPHQHPLLYLKDITYHHIVSIINFMYYGEVNVAQEDLNTFLTVAEELKVKGLTQKESNDSKKSESKMKPASSSNFHAKIKKPAPIQTFTSQSIQGHDDDIQEVVPVKSEPPALVETGLVANDQYMDYGEEYDNAYEDSQNYEDPYNSTANSKESCSELMTQVVSDQDNLKSASSWSCLVCGKILVSKAAMEDHIRGSHLGSQQMFPCQYCGKQFQSRNSRSGHISKNHKS